MNSIIEWIKTNISWVKELFWIAFTSVATFVAILTYRRARHTILQPLRSEVVKRQTDLLAEILKFLDERAVFMNDAYLDTMTCNLFCQLKEYGILVEEDGLEQQIEELEGGYNIVTGKTVHKVGDISEKDAEILFSKRVIEKRDLAKAGQFELDVIYLSKSYFESVNTLESFINNPYLPTKIKQKLQKLLFEIRSNVGEPLYETIIDAISEIVLQDIAEEEKKGIHPMAEHNRWRHHPQMYMHTNTINAIVHEIRKYLMVDKMWS